MERRGRLVNETLEALRDYNSLILENPGGKVRCPICWRWSRYSKHRRKTLRYSARMVLRSHFVRIHPELTDERSRSLLLDRAVEGL